jgi:transposase
MRSSRSAASNSSRLTAATARTERRMAPSSAGIDACGRWNGCLRALQNYRRIVVRYERYPENFLGMLHLACWLILLRVFMG